MYINHDSRGREILSDMPASFTVPGHKRISTLDFHRQRLLEQREMMRRMLEDICEDQEYETFKEANDFAVKDPLDEETAYRTDFELDDDDLDVSRVLAEESYRNLAQQTENKTVASTEKQSPPESAS